MRGIGTFRLFFQQLQRLAIRLALLKEKSECPHSLLPVTLLLVVAGPAAAEARAERTLSPYFLVQGEEATGTFPLSSTHVTVEISGVVADVRVEQTYVNEGSEPINARYVFPASTRAAVHGMRMRVGEEVVVAKIREREVARQEFEEAKGTGKTTSLLDEERPNVFTMNVSNIMPADRVEVELNYTELLVPTERTYSFVYPAVVGPRYGSVPEDTAPATECWIKSPYLPQGDPPSATFDIELTLSAGLPVAETRSPSHEVASSWDGSTRVHVRLADPSDFGGDRDFVWDYRLAGMEIEAGLLLQRGETENYFLLVLQPPAVVGGGDLPAREYVFVLDVSGSMDGFPLETAKAVIADLISGLGQTDRFNVILFAGGSSVLASASVPATPENVAQFENRRGELERAQADALTQAQEKASKLDGFMVQITQKAGADGKLFGSVTNVDISEALNAQHFDVPKAAIRMPQGPLKQVGDHPVKIALHADVVVTVTVSVLGEQ